MEKKSRSELTLSFLLIAAVCLEAQIIHSVFFSGEHLKWKEARQHCQENFLGLVTLNIVDEQRLIRWLDRVEVQDVWLGRFRDPEDGYVWKWTDGLSGGNSSTDTMVNGKEVSNCAVVGNDHMWYSDLCTNYHTFHCSTGDRITHFHTGARWIEAIGLCKDQSLIIATVTESNANETYSDGWIGLRKNPGDPWRWFGESTDYTNWAPGEPLIDCGSFNAENEKQVSTMCSEELQFFCYSDNLVIVNENKTWEAALKHCRDMETPCSGPTDHCLHDYDLLILTSQSDYSYVRHRIHSATTDEVWTGLRFLGGEWFWVNGQKMEYHDCPSQWRHCGTLSKHNTSKWTIRDCSEERNFICVGKIHM